MRTGEGALQYSTVEHEVSLEELQYSGMSTERLAADVATKLYYQLQKAKREKKS